MIGFDLCSQNVCGRVFVCVASFCFVYQFLYMISFDLCSQNVCGRILVLCGSVSVFVGLIYTLGLYMRKEERDRKS